MLNRTVVVNHQTCNPQQCKGGVCQASLICVKSAFHQEAPYQRPTVESASCLNCLICAQACPSNAVHIE